MEAGSSEFAIETDKNGAIYVNIQGLFTKSKKNKICYLRDLAKESNSPFIVVTETWLTEQILDAEIQIPNYTLYRSDRANGRSHGGSCVYVRSTLTSQMILCHSNGTCDSLAVKVKNFETLVICMYRPPDTNLEQFKESLETVQEAIDETMKTDPKCRTILQLGDYNFPFLKWPNGTIYENKIPEEKKADVKKQAEAFLEYCQENSLVQYCLTPTRGKNILDLILTNNQTLINNYTTIVNKQFSDHFVLKVWLNVSYNQETKQPRKYPYTTNLYQYDFEQADDEDWLRYDAMLATVDFEEEVKGMNTGQRLRRFYEVLEGTTKEIFKKKKEFEDDTEKTETNNKPKNFIPKRIRSLMKRKSKLSQKILASIKWWKTVEMEEELENIEMELDEEYKKKKMKAENDAIKKIKKDPTYFYNYAKKSSKSPNQIGPFIEKDGTIVTDPFEKAEKLRKQYESAYSKPDEKWIIPDVDIFFSVSGQEQEDCPECEEERVHECRLDWEGSGVQEQQQQDSPSSSPQKIEGVFFDFMDVTLAINDIPSGAAPGPDGVPPCLLKKAKVNIARMLILIWQESYDSGTIPDILKLALICPVHKSGSRAEPSQYRPISLTSHLIKVMERMLRRQLIGFLEMNNKMDPNQHGSRGKRSCLSQLLEHHLEILEMLERGENVDSIYLDFSKAFDKCDINLLLQKVKTLGITGKIGKWIHAFLTSRTQYIIVNGTKSNVSKVISGIPQGTVLGPILFLIYISDIGENVEAKLKIYVDDTKAKKTINNEDDVESLQKDLDAMYTWAENNNMKFNGTRFQIMRYGTNQEIKDDTTYFTEEMNEPIDRFEKLKDLGVIMNDEANFKDHLEKANSKARNKTGWILRTFFSRNTWFMKHMLKTLVMPHIDFCSQLWMPIDAAGVLTLEKIQFDFFKKIPELRGKSYWECLIHMKMLSVQRRLERYRILYTWKILENLSPNCGISEIPESSKSRQGRRLEILKSKGNAQTSKLKDQCFQVNGSRLFNCLPSSIRNMSSLQKNQSKCPVSLDEFKEKLDKYLESIPDQPRIDGLSPGVESNSILHQTKRGQGGGLPPSFGA